MKSIADNKAYKENIRIFISKLKEDEKKLQEKKHIPAKQLLDQLFKKEENNQ